MKVKHFVLIVLLGVGLRYIDSLFEMIITILSNMQAVHATNSQLKMNQMMAEVEDDSDDEFVITGFVGDDVSG